MANLPMKALARTLENEMRKLEPAWEKFDKAMDRQLDLFRKEETDDPKLIEQTNQAYRELKPIQQRCIDLVVAIGKGEVSAAEAKEMLLTRNTRAKVLEIAINLQTESGT